MVALEFEEIILFRGKVSNGGMFQVFMDESAWLKDAMSDISGHHQIQIRPFQFATGSGMFFYRCFEFKVDPILVRSVIEQEFIYHFAGYQGIFLAASDDFRVWYHMLQFIKCFIKILWVLGC